MAVTSQIIGKLGGGASWETKNISVSGYIRKEVYTGRKRFVAEITPNGGGTSSYSLANGASVNFSGTMVVAGESGQSLSLFNATLLRVIELPD